jgi:hypothetical protein
MFYILLKLLIRPVFLAPNQTFTGNFNYLPLYSGPDRPDSMLYYLVSCCGSTATLPEPQLLLLPTVTCVQSHHVPKSPAEMQKSQLWTFITFFWLGFVTPYFTTNLVYMYRSFIQSLFRYCAAKKKSFFYDPGLSLSLSLHVIL